MDVKPYHHGELRSALVAAALDLLEREGPSALTLRGLARSVGVSPMAPYHHFASRAELLAAVAAAGFDRLQQGKEAVLAASGASVEKALVAGTANYVAFMLEHPNLHRLMKGPDLADRDAHPELQRAAAAPAAQLRGLIKTLLGSDSRHDPDACAQMLWGLAHGIGTLALDRQIAVETADALARRGAEAMIAGWLAEG